MGGAKDPPASVRHLCRAPNRALCRWRTRARPRPSSSCSTALLGPSALDARPSTILHSSLVIRHWPAHIGTHPRSLKYFLRLSAFFLRQIAPGQIDLSVLWTMSFLGKRGSRVGNLGPNGAKVARSREPTRPQGLSASASMALTARRETNNES